MMVKFNYKHWACSHRKVGDGRCFTWVGGAWMPMIFMFSQKKVWQFRKFLYLCQCYMGFITFIYGFNNK